MKSKGWYTDENALEKFCRDMLVDATSVEPITGRDAAINEVEQLLCREGFMRHVILVGEPGVGKTALVEGIAQRLLRGEVRDELKTVKHVYSLNVGALIAGTKFRGDFEKRFEKVMAEVVEANGDIIVFIDEMHMMMGAGESENGNMDGANLLKPYLARGSSRFIGATTRDEYNRIIRQDLAFSRRFEVFDVKEPSIADATNMLRQMKEGYQKRYNVKILDRAVVAAVKLSSNFIKDRYLPDKAISVLHEACMSVRNQVIKGPPKMVELETKLGDIRNEIEALKSDCLRYTASQARIAELKKELVDGTAKLEEMRIRFSSNGEKLVKLHDEIDFREPLIVAYENAEEDGLDEDTVTVLRTRLTEADNKIDNIISDMMVTDIVGPKDVNKVITRRTGIPMADIGIDERERLMRLEDTLNEVIVGQKEAVKSVIDALIGSRGGPELTGRPIGNFLFAGLPGVGKTELAIAVAVHFFGGKESLIRIDMSEYMNPGSGNRLIGGTGTDDCLAERVRQNPYSVVLLDEIDKAHSSVYKLLLQMMGHGRLTTIKGQVVDFTNTLIVLTSNIGAGYIIEALSGNRTMTDARQMVEDAARARFSHELVNRLDELVVFKPLSFDQILPISKIMINETIVGYAALGIGLEVTDAALNHVLAGSFSEAEGARQIRRIISKNIGNKVARMRVFGEIAEGARVIVDVGPNGDGLVFRREVDEE